MRSCALASACCTWAAKPRSAAYASHWRSAHSASMSWASGWMQPCAPSCSLRKETLRSIETRLQSRHVGRQLPELSRREERLRSRLSTAAGAALSRRQSRLGTAASQLGALSPLRVLERGYALVYAEDGTLLRSATQTSEGQRVRARLAEGSLQARVEAVMPDGG